MLGARWARSTPSIPPQPTLGTGLSISNKMSGHSESCGLRWFHFPTPWGEPRGFSSSGYTRPAMDAHSTSQPALNSHFSLPCCPQSTRMTMMKHITQPVPSLWRGSQGFRETPKIQQPQLRAAAEPRGAQQRTGCRGVGERWGAALRGAPNPSTPLRERCLAGTRAGSPLPARWHGGAASLVISLASRI